MMSLENRLQSLKTQHADLEYALSEAQNQPANSGETLAALKKQKLALKDEIKQIEQTLKLP